MIWSRIGFTGSDTQACSGMVRIGSLMPAMRATSLDAPATACTILPARTTPRGVSTPTARPFSMRMRLTGVCVNTWAPRLMASLAYPQATASWRAMAPGG